MNDIFFYQIYIYKQDVFKEQTVQRININWTINRLSWPSEANNEYQYSISFIRHMQVVLQWNRPAPRPYFVFFIHLLFSPHCLHTLSLFFLPVRTALIAIIGFMPTKGEGAIGSLDYTPEERRALAKK